MGVWTAYLKERCLHVTRTLESKKSREQVVVVGGGELITVDVMDPAQCPASALLALLFSPKDSPTCFLTFLQPFCLEVF